QFRILTNDDWVQVTLPKINPLVDFFDPVSKKNKKGMTEGKGEISAVIGITENAPNGNQTLNLELVYQACTNTYCLLPKKIPISFDVKISGGNSIWAQGFKKLEPITQPSLLESYLDNSLWMTFLIVFIAGILTSFTPCIFPMIPITMAVLGTRTKEHSKIAGLGLSFSYVLGIAFTYSLLGLLAASTGALFGSFLGHPAVAVGLGILFFILALGMYGVYELQVPVFIRNRLGLHKNQGGWVGAFVTGQLAGLLASPCVGPVLVALLAYVAKTQNLLLGFLLLFTFAFGMGQIFLVIGTFSQALQKLPKAGPWMVSIKIIMGTAMLALSFYYIRPVFSQWTPQSEVHKKWDTKVLPWQPYSEEALASAAQSGKAVVIDFFADWCAACVEMEVKTFPQPEIQKLKDQFVWLKFDATDASTPEFKTLQKKYNIPGLPWFVFYSKNGILLKNLTLAGFESEVEFSSRLKSVLK
ncbi:MAG: thioredoxin family protein, partial [Bdellovibrionales bacterium]|nr:thioredoxin family protein [Bdellovibrionales bacterium]